jgi:hypothetical protein
MTNPIVVDLPHNLGAEEARRRIAGSIDRLSEHLPGGADVRSAWHGDQLDLGVRALGQEVAARIEPRERTVRLEVRLPPGLAFLGGMIEAALRRKGADMLEDKSDGARG